jgi:hypothetical protein
LVDGVGSTGRGAGFELDDELGDPDEPEEPPPGTTTTVGLADGWAVAGCREPQARPATMASEVATLRTATTRREFSAGCVRRR